MKRTKKKGFTIVELTIVIAVIAILAAVLIPTFSSVVDKANQSADIQLIRQANVVLQAATANGSSLTKAEAEQELKNNSITLGTPSGSDNEFIYLPGENRFVIYNTQKKAVAYPEDLVTEMSNWKPEFTIRYHDGLNLIYTKDADGNKIYGFVDQEEKASGEMKYSIKDGVVTVTATGDDGCGFTTLNADLNKDLKYTFWCNVNKPNSNEAVGWDNKNGDGKVMTSLGYDVWIFGTGWSFTSGKTASYSIRFDVNKTGETALFSEVRLVEGNEKVSGYMSKSSLAFGATENLTANAFAREEYTFKCWNTERDGSGIAVKDGASIKDLIEAGIDPGTVTLYAHWTE